MLLNHFITEITWRHMVKWCWYPPGPILGISATSLSWLTGLSQLLYSHCPSHSPNTRSPLERQQAPRPALSLVHQHIVEFGYPKRCHSGSRGLTASCLAEPDGAQAPRSSEGAWHAVIQALLLKLLFLSRSPPHSPKLQWCQKYEGGLFFHLQIQPIATHGEVCYCAHLTFSFLTNLPKAKMGSPKRERTWRKVKSRKEEVSRL